VLLIFYYILLAASISNISTSTGISVLGSDRQATIEKKVSAFVLGNKYPNYTPGPHFG
jgi:hypothetical protein